MDLAIYSDSRELASVLVLERDRRKLSFDEKVVALVSIGTTNVSYAQQRNL